MRPRGKKPDMDGGTSEDGFRGSVREASTIAIAWGLGLFALLAWLRSGHWPLRGFDAFYHLSAASWLASEGLGVHHLPWTRLSVFAEHWGDKEWLFHVLLIPFTGIEDGVRAGQLALSALNGLEAAALAYVAVRWCGRKGAWLPLLVPALHGAIWARLDLLRPHHLSLVWTIAACHLVAARRPVGLGVVAALYALSYTAWQALALLIAGTAVLLLVFRKERSRALLLATAIGITVGILGHPAFPENVRIWLLQNVDYYRFKTDLGFETEIQPMTTVSFLLTGLTGWILAAMAGLTTRPWSGAAPASRVEAVAGAFALAFSGLALLALRFLEYAVPFVALWGFLAVDRLSANPTHPPGRRGQRDVLLGTLAVFGLLLNGYAIATSGVRAGSEQFFHDREEMEAFADAVPEGARVAARWDATAFYVFAAPHGTYLNVLDPVFAFAVDRERGRLADDLFRSRVPDLAWTVRHRLASDYLAFPHVAYPDLMDRADRDPRLERVFRGSRQILYRVIDDDRFVTDWEETILGHPSPGAHAMEPGRAWVSSTSPKSTEAWSRTYAVDEPTRLRVGFGSDHPALVFLDHELVLESRGERTAVVDAIEFSIRLEPDRTNRVEVRIPMGGFFFRELGREPIEPVSSPRDDPPPSATSAPTPTGS